MPGSKSTERAGSGKKIVVDRSAGGHSLLNCQAQVKKKEGKGGIIGVRGELLDNRLARLTFHFVPKVYPMIVNEFETRFGKANVLTFKENTILGQETLDTLVWRQDEEIWLLRRGRGQTTLLIHQDLKASRVLPEPSPPAKRGKPVSLEDIGIGKLDLTAPLPKIELPDAG